MNDFTNGRRPVQQSYKTIVPRPTPDNPYPNVSSARVAIQAKRDGWRPPYQPGSGPNQLLPERGTVGLPEWASHRLVGDADTMEEYLRAVQGRENPDADPRLRNPASSATGLFQLTKPAAERYGMNWERDRFNPQAQHEVTRLMTEDNKRRLEAAGFAPTFANLYLLHFAGDSGGMAVLEAPNDKPISGILREPSIRSNERLLRGKTAGDVKASSGSEKNIDHGPAGSRMDKGPPLFPLPIQATPIDPRAPFSPNGVPPARNQFGIPYAASPASRRLPDEGTWPRSPLDLYSRIR